MTNPSICPRCGKPATLNRTVACQACRDEAEAQAKAEQERDYLVRWLSTRDEHDDPWTVRCRQKATALGLDRLQPPEPTTFPRRLKRILTAR
jgi:hypothetical protein